MLGLGKQRHVTTYFNNCAGNEKLILLRWPFPKIINKDGHGIRILRMQKGAKNDDKDKKNNYVHSGCCNYHFVAGSYSGRLGAHVFI